MACKRSAVRSRLAPPITHGIGWNFPVFSFYGFPFGKCLEKSKSYIFDSGSVMRDSRSRPPHFLFLIRFIKLTFLVSAAASASFALL